MIAMAAIPSRAHTTSQPRPMTAETAPAYHVDDRAKNAFHSNPQNTVFDAKCPIGRKSDKSEVQRVIKH